MGALLRVVDERFSATPTRVQALELRLVSERVSAREIIRRRVEAEVDILNARRLEHLSKGPSHSLLIERERGSAEAILNSARSTPRASQKIDVDAEVTRAITAFAAGRFLMLLDDRQFEDLDEEVTLRPEGEVVFLYLTPLKGG